MSSKRNPFYMSAVLLFVTVSTGIILSSGGVLADDVVDNIAITVPEICSLSSQTGTGETYSVSMNAGQYKNDTREVFGCSQTAFHTEFSHIYHLFHLRRPDGFHSLRQ